MGILAWKLCQRQINRKHNCTIEMWKYLLASISCSFPEFFQKSISGESHQWPIHSIPVFFPFTAHKISTVSFASAPECWSIENISMQHHRILLKCIKFSEIFEPMLIEKARSLINWISSDRIYFSAGRKAVQRISAL